jgi:hypothetical protein
MSGMYSQPENLHTLYTAVVRKKKIEMECEDMEEASCKSNESCDWNGETCYDPLPAPPVNRGEKPPPISRSNKPSNYDDEELGGGSRKRRSRKTKAKAKANRKGKKTRKSGRKAKRSGSKRSRSKRRQTKRS